MWLLFEFIAATAVFAQTETARGVDISSRPVVPIEGSRPLELSPQTTGPAEIKILQSFFQENSTRLILQSNQALVVGNDVYAGVDEIPVNVGTLLSKSGDFYYYAGTANGRVRFKTDDLVRLERTKRLSVGSAIASTFDQQALFSQKYFASITAVQGDRAMIDKGTLQRVHERDLYRIFDENGKSKGTLEIQGIGDLQSSGQLYSGWWKKKASTPEMKPGDKAEFVGQRRLLALGAVGGSTFERRQIFYAQDQALGGGLLWNITFSDGWGVEMLFGEYARSGTESVTTRLFFAQRDSIRSERSAHFIAPLWLKKNFFFPSLVSPFVAMGGSFLDARHFTEIFISNEGRGAEDKRRRSIVPMVGAGIELFPSRFFRPRIDVRHFFGPRVWSSGNAFRTESTFYSFGVMTAW